MGFGASELLIARKVLAGSREAVCSETPSGRVHISLNGFDGLSGASRMMVSSDPARLCASTELLIQLLLRNLI